jgi:uncharacterized membrane protein
VAAPNICAEYETIIPGFTRNVVAEMAKETAHRRRLETTGQWMAFVIAISFLLVAGGLIATGHDVAGGVLGTVDLLGLVSVFLYRNRALPRASKREALSARRDSSSESSP